MKKNKYNIIHITNELSEKNYSISTLILFLINKLIKDTNNKIFVETVKLKPDLAPSVQIVLFKNRWLDFFNIKNKIIASNQPNTIFHLHGLWSTLQLYSFIILTYFNFPTVVHAHGMLLAPALNQNGHIKKKVKNFILFFLKLLSKNKKLIFIAITIEEKLSIVQYFPQAEILIIPNPIPFEKNINNKKFNFTNKKIFTFFGRIHPHKNIEYIINLFLKSKLPKNCYLHIYGINDDLEYLAKLKKLIQANKNIKILQPVFGNRKLKIMNLAWVNILLSKSEVLSLSLLESGLNGLPTLVNENFYLPENDTVSIKARSNDVSTMYKFQEIANWSKTHRESLFKKSVHSFQVYKKNTEKFLMTQIYNLYTSINLQIKKTKPNFSNFIFTSIIYGFNFFLPSSMVVFFYLSGNAEIAAESGIFIISSISITQILSSNMRSLAIANKAVKINLDSYFIFRFLFSIVYLTILVFLILPKLHLQYPTFIFFLSCTILLQWIFEIKLVKYELQNNQFNQFNQFIILACYSMIVIVSIFLSTNNNVASLNYLLILFCLCILGSISKDFLLILKNINLNKFSFFFLKKHIINFSFSPLFSSFSLVFSGLFWRFSIYSLFEKSIAGLLFAGYTLGSFSATLFNLILGPAYIKTKIKLGRKTKFFVFLLFSFILFLNINIYLNLEYTYEIFEDYLFNVDKLFYIVSMHSILGSFFMTYAMYQRHRMISYQSREQKVFIRDLIYNIIISALFPFLYWLNNVDGIVNLFLISSLIAVIFYKPLLISFYKK
jgi:glycosyltransferase involved in cell wall biosynthesis